MILKNTLSAECNRLPDGGIVHNIYIGILHQAIFILRITHLSVVLNNPTNPFQSEIAEMIKAIIIIAPIIKLSRCRLQM